MANTALPLDAITSHTPAKPKGKPQQDLTVKAPDGRVLFSHDELADKEEFKGQGIIPRAVLDDLRELRLAVGLPMGITSACRARARNVEVGGAGHSFHIWDTPRPEMPGTVAFDVDQSKWTLAQRINFARIAWHMGWSLGLHATFTHVDRRHRYGFGQVWGTYKKAPPAELVAAVHEIAGRPGGKW